MSVAVTFPFCFALFRCRFHFVHNCPWVGDIWDVEVCTTSNWAESMAKFRSQWYGQLCALFRPQLCFVLFYDRDIQRNKRATGCLHCFSIVIYPPDFPWFGFHSRSNDNYEFSVHLCLASNWNQFDSRVFQNWSINWKARFVPNNEMLQTK